MFKISKGQMTEVDRLVRDGFHRRLAAFLRVELPEETTVLDDVALAAFILESEQRALLHGIETELGIARWACFRLAAEPDFDRHAEFKEYMNVPGMNPERKLELLIEQYNALACDVS